MTSKQAKKRKDGQSVKHELFETGRAAKTKKKTSPIQNWRGN